MKDGWYWANEDVPVRGPLPTLREVIGHVAGAPVLERHGHGPGAFEYLFGFPGEDSCSQWYIFRAESEFGYMLGSRDGQHINQTMWLRTEFPDGVGKRGRSHYLPRCSCGWGCGEDQKPSTGRARAQKLYLEHLRDVGGE